MTTAGLPTIMVAPNGARRTKADHPQLPVTISETVAAAKACFEAGAGALHAHVRDGEQAHLLDAGLYRELLAEMKRQVPEMLVQITTEAVGRYTPEEQRRLVADVRPEAVSVALREMLPGESDKAGLAFYAQAQSDGIAVQHILYDEVDFARYLDLRATGMLPEGPAQVLFVLGRYSVNQESTPEDLDAFTALLDRPDAVGLDWAVCAFGHRETDCLEAAILKGGKARIGFENSLWNAEGTLASDNAERVSELAARLSLVRAKTT